MFVCDVRHGVACRVVKKLPFIFVSMLVVACKNNDAPAGAGATPSASASVAKPVTEAGPAPQKPVLGTAVKGVACNLGPNVPEGENNIAASRHLHLGPGNKLYFFADFKGPTRLDPVDDGCGYRFGETLTPPKDIQYGLEPDGSIKEYPNSDESPVRKCREKAFDKMRYGTGALVGGVYYYKDHDELTQLDLASPTCEPKPAKIAELPKEDEFSQPSISWSGNDLLLGFTRQALNNNLEVLRFDAKGHLVKKYGQADRKNSIVGNFVGCGDGLCASSGSSDIDIFRADGTVAGSYRVSEWVKLEQIEVANIVDVPGKGVYVLIGYHDEKKKGRAELIRLDGVHE